MQISKPQKMGIRPKSADNAFTPSKLKTFNRGEEKQKMLRQKYDKMWEDRTQQRTFRAREFTSREPEVVNYFDHRRCLKDLLPRQLFLKN